MSKQLNEYGIRQRTLINETTRIDFDIVVVHGLGGHALRTFTGKNGKNWVTDVEFLQKDFPNSRIFTFGYNANNFTDTTRSRVADHAKSLLVELLPERVGCENRPIVFIAHSLGGIIVKKALILSTALQAYKDILQNTTAIIFLGTPHQGADMAKWLGLAKTLAAWATLHKENPNPLTVELQPFSDTLGDVAGEFKDIGSNFIMRSSVEQKPTDLPRPLGRCLIVEAASAQMGHPNEEVVPVPDTHEGMTKFNTPEDDGYIAIRKQLKFLMAKSLEIVALKNESESLRSRLDELGQQTINERFDVDFLENTRFIGRVNELQAIFHYFNSQGDRLDQQKRVVIHGLGGIGKTSIALRYCYSQKRFYNGVFWLNASPAEGRETYSTLVDQLKDLESSLGLSLREWCRIQQRRWLLVIDCLDDLRGFDERKLAGIIPSHGFGHVIITSRRVRLSKLAGLNLDIECMEAADGAKLLLSSTPNRVREPKDDSTALQIVHMLGGLPMAITQCAATVNFLQDSLPNYSIAYNDLLKKISIPEAMSSILDDDDDEPTFASSEEAKTILTTWELSFSHITRKNQAAADLLCVLIWFDIRDIEEDILHRAFSSKTRWGMDGNRTEALLTSTDVLPSLASLALKENPNWKVQIALGILMDFSLLFRLRRGKRVYMNPITAYWIEHRKQRERAYYLRNAASMLNQSLVHPYFDTGLGLNRERLRNAMIHEDHLVRLYRCQMVNVESLDTETSYSLLQLWITVQELITQGYEFRMMRYPDLYISENATNVRVSRFKITDKGLIPGGSMSNVEHLEIYFGFAEHLLSNCSDRVHVWFHAFTAFFHEIEPRFRGQSDLFRNLKDVRFGGRTWSEQKAALGQKFVDEEENGMASTMSQLDIDESSSSLSQGPGNSKSMPKLVNTDAHYSAIQLLPHRDGDDELTRSIPLINAHICQIALKLIAAWRAHRDTVIPIDVERKMYYQEKRTGDDIVQLMVSGLAKLHPHSDFETLRNGQFCQHLAKAKDVNNSLKLQLLDIARCNFNKVLGPNAQRSFYALKEEALFCLSNGGHQNVDKMAEVICSYPLDKSNFAVISGMMEIQWGSLKERGKKVEMLAFLTKQLNLFESASDETISSPWTFPFDPVLDTLELLILSYGDENDQEAVQQYRARYVQYTRDRYGQHFEWYLGFGIGTIDKNPQARRVKIDQVKNVRDMTNWSTGQLEKYK